MLICRQRKIENMLTKSITISALCLMVLFSQTVAADARTQAKRIHDRLTGTPPGDTILNEMEDRMSNTSNAEYDPSGKTAAEMAMDDPAFYNVTLKNFAAPWTNEAQTVFTPLNDYTATIIGMIRDDEDFRQVLHGDIIYTANSGPAYSNSNNDHYEALKNTDLSTLLERKTQSSVTGLPAAATAGIMTTRAAARSFFYKGTSRAMFRFTLMNHLCTDLEPLKDNTRTPDRVHQDVSRSPGGDSRIYLNSCVACHAGMDGFMGAYAYYDLVFNEDGDGNVIENTAQMVYTPGSVQAKFLINENNFKPGHITTDDSWINYWRKGQNALLGWNNDYPGFQQNAKGNVIGDGAKTMGMELAYTDAFAQCQVKKAFQTVCLRDPDDYSADKTEVNAIVADFKTDGYKMKNVFRDVAAYCKGN